MLAVLSEEVLKALQETGRTRMMVTSSCSINGVDFQCTSTLGANEILLLAFKGSSQIDVPDWALSKNLLEAIEGDTQVLKKSMVILHKDGSLSTQKSNDKDKVYVYATGFMADFSLKA